MASIPRERILVVFGAFLLAVVFSIVAAGGNVLPGDVAVAKFIQRAPESPGQKLADTGNWLGSAKVCGLVSLVFGLALLTIRRPWDAALVVSAFAVRWVNGLLKLAIESPRPTAGLVRVTELASNYGFPSGHAMGAALCYGAIAIIFHRSVRSVPIRRTAELGCALIVPWVGFGRVYVGAHWPSDVVGGYLWGFLILSAVATLLTALHARFALRSGSNRQSPPVY